MKTEFVSVFCDEEFNGFVAIKGLAVDSFYAKCGRVVGYESGCVDGGCVT